MQSAVEKMLEKYNCKNANEYKNSLKEIIQEIALSGLYKSGFFKKAAFYGGSALRIFHSLERFSEDIDFSLLSKNDNFSIEPFCNAIKEELASYGFEMEVIIRTKKTKTNIESAFIKGGTLINLFKIRTINPPVSGINKNETLKIKFEIDINPPSGAEYENKYHLNPFPFTVKLYDLPSQFAGKIHSILCRKWKIRVKGRDLYDYIWFISKNTNLNLAHLSERMKQTGHLSRSDSLNIRTLKNMLKEKFNSLDYKQAINDVKTFLRNPDETELWSKKFFVTITNDFFKE
ncbi:MAG: nucleotidyl transferase AbiEii/AbiGii toxin family protein [Ignavibacteria bacterium]|nr:nucleotidyl transferase AbiEii/AbiGii toxin family protein [Ignavibacteria bacterium]